MSPALTAILTVAALLAFVYIVWKDTQRILNKRDTAWRRKW